MTDEEIRRLQDDLACAVVIRDAAREASNRDLEARRVAQQAADQAAGEILRLRLFMTYLEATLRTMQFAAPETLHAHVEGISQELKRARL